ncbi:MAG: LysR family transcriptional regulator, partial [Ancalomicrobiaceae bacterium]|nr:LysR family transcriptional regulator [Ancalomicrobiaceae bacterium]
ITRVPCYQAAAAVRAGELKVILEDLEPPAMPVNLVHTGERLVPLKLRAFLDFTAPRVKLHLSEATCVFREPKS